jgi:hypothetical protein
MTRQMSSLAHTWQRILDRARTGSGGARAANGTPPRIVNIDRSFDFAPDDPLLAHLTSRSTAVDLDTLDIESRARATLQRPA